MPGCSLQTPPAGSRKCLSVGGWDRDLFPVSGAPRPLAEAPSFIDPAGCDHTAERVEGEMETAWIDAGQTVPLTEELCATRTHLLLPP